MSDVPLISVLGSYGGNQFITAMSAFRAEAASPMEYPHSHGNLLVYVTLHARQEATQLRYMPMILEPLTRCVKV